MNAVLQSEVNEIFNLGDPVMKYAVSWVMVYVSHDAIQHLLINVLELSQGPWASGLHTYRKYDTDK